MERKPWKHYDKPVFWQLPNDGDGFHCMDCKEKFHHTKVILTQIPKDDSRKVLCLDCIDEDWLKLATNLGPFPD